MLVTCVRLAAPRNAEDHVGPAGRGLQGEVTPGIQGRCCTLASRGAQGHRSGDMGQCVHGRAGRCPSYRVRPAAGTELLGAAFTL